jgi:hypothetical protein
VATARPALALVVIGAFVAFPASPDLFNHGRWPAQVVEAERDCATMGTTMTRPIHWVPVDFEGATPVPCRAFLAGANDRATSRPVSRIRLKTYPDSTAA